MNVQDSVSELVHHRWRNALQVPCKSDHVGLMLAEELKQLCHVSVFRGEFLLTDVDRWYVPRTRNLQRARFCFVAHHQRHSRWKDAVFYRVENCLKV